MISLIMRVGPQPRLQYTILSLESLARQINAPPFEVIIVDNGANDGTAQWVAAIQRTESARTYFPPMRYLKPEMPLKDWPGMVYGAEHILPNTKYIGQLDNDIVLAPRAIALATQVLKEKKARVVMLQRHGVRGLVPQMKNMPTVSHTINGTAVKLQPVPWCVAFWLTGAEHFKTASKCSSCRKFTGAIKNCQKILGKRATQLEGWALDGPKTYTQKRKYDIEKWKMLKKKGIIVTTSWYGNTVKEYGI